MRLTIWTKEICLKNQDGEETSFSFFPEPVTCDFLQILPAGYLRMAVATLVSSKSGIVAMCGMTEGLQDLLLLNIVTWLAYIDHVMNLSRLS